jgi:sRNA-binding carbon storage regulator CsrA
MGESLLIGNNIRITVMVVYEEKIKLRIQNSEDITIKKRLGETITLRDDITVTVVNIDKYQVKLGIQAPNNIKIKRE